MHMNMYRSTRPAIGATAPGFKLLVAFVFAMALRHTHLPDAGDVTSPAWALTLFHLYNPILFFVRKWLEDLSFL